MNLYICSQSASMQEDINGFYYLIAETGEQLAMCWCSSKCLAKDLLYESRKGEITARYGECNCVYLGTDDMTSSMLLRLNQIWWNKRFHRDRIPPLNKSFNVDWMTG